MDFSAAKALMERTSRMGGGQTQDKPYGAEMGSDAFSQQNHHMLSSQQVNMNMLSQMQNSQSFAGSQLPYHSQFPVANRMANAPSRRTFQKFQPHMTVLGERVNREGESYVSVLDELNEMKYIMCPSCGSNKLFRVWTAYRKHRQHNECINASICRQMVHMSQQQQQLMLPMSSVPIDASNQFRNLQTHSTQGIPFQSQTMHMTNIHHQQSQMRDLPTESRQANQYQQQNWPANVPRTPVHGEAASTSLRHGHQKDQATRNNVHDVSIDRPRSDYLMLTDEILAMADGLLDPVEEDTSNHRPPYSPFESTNEYGEPSSEMPSMGTNALLLRSFAGSPKTSPRQIRLSPYSHASGYHQPPDDDDWFAYQEDDACHNMRQSPLVEEVPASPPNAAPLLAIKDAPREFNQGVDGVDDVMSLLEAVEIPTIKSRGSSHHERGIQPPATDMRRRLTFSAPVNMCNVVPFEQPVEDFLFDVDLSNNKAIQTLRKHELKELTVKTKSASTMTDTTKTKVVTTQTDVKLKTSAIQTDTTKSKSVAVMASTSPTVRNSGNQCSILKWNLRPELAKRMNSIGVMTAGPKTKTRGMCTGRRSKWTSDLEEGQKSKAVNTDFTLVNSLVQFKVKVANSSTQSNPKPAWRHTGVQADISPPRPSTASKSRPPQSCISSKRVKSPGPGLQLERKRKRRKTNELPLQKSAIVAVDTAMLQVVKSKKKRRRSASLSEANHALQKPLDVSKGTATPKHAATSTQTQHGQSGILKFETNDQPPEPLHRYPRRSSRNVKEEQGAQSNSSSSKLGLVKREPELKKFDPMTVPTLIDKSGHFDLNGQFHRLHVEYQRRREITNFHTTRDSPNLNGYIATEIDLDKFRKLTSRKFVLPMEGPQTTQPSEVDAQCALCLDEVCDLTDTVVVCRLGCGGKSHVSCFLDSIENALAAIASDNQYTIRLISLLQMHSLCNGLINTKPTSDHPNLKRLKIHGCDYCTVCLAKQDDNCEIMPGFMAKPSTCAWLTGKAGEDPKPCYIIANLSVFHGNRSKQSLQRYSAIGLLEPQQSNHRYRGYYHRLVPTEDILTWSEITKLDSRRKGNMVQSQSSLGVKVMRKLKTKMATLIENLDSHGVGLFQTCNYGQDIVTFLTSLESLHQTLHVTKVPDSKPPKCICNEKELSGLELLSRLLVTEVYPIWTGTKALGSHIEADGCWIWPVFPTRQIFDLYPWEEFVAYWFDELRTIKQKDGNNRPCTPQVSILDEKKESSENAVLEDETPETALFIRDI